MPTKIDLDTKTLGELKGLRREYTKIFNILINTPDRHMLGQVTTFLGELSTAIYVHNTLVVETLEDDVGEDYWKDIVHYKKDFYRQFTEEWDRLRCEAALKLMGEESCHSKRVLRDKIEMFKLLGM